MGLLDTFNTPGMDLAMGLLSAGGPSDRPIGFGQALGMGLQNMRQGQLARLQTEEAMQGNLLKKMQMDAMKKQLATKEALSNAIKGAANRTPGGLSPSSAATFGAPEMAFDGKAPAMSDVMLNAALEAGDYDAYQEAMKLKMEEKKLGPKWANEPRTVMGPNGPMLVQMADDGSVKPMTGYGPADKLHFADTGGAVMGVNPYTGQPVAKMGKTMSPDAQASNALGYTRLAFDRDQAAKPQFKDGYWVVPPTAGNATGRIIETPLSAPPKGSPQATRQSSDKVIGLIDQADKLLEESTNSYVGTGADMAAQAFGVSTKGAKAAAQLKAMEGAIMMAQPRMEGPQSDKDVALYRQMAGMIGDSTVPADTRRAALATIRELHQRYASPQVTPKSAIGGGGWSATVVK